MNHLAMNGGPKAIEEPLPSFRDHSGRSLGDEEIAELTDVIRSGALSFLTGRKTAAFERGFADLLGVREAVAVANGTAALHAAVIYLNPEPGDEIILSPVTDIGTAIPIMAQLAVPVFADVDPATQNVTAATIEACLTPRTRAIIVTHVFGAPADMDPIMELAERRGLFVIEDCAQAHLATYKGRICGTIGHLGCFSFQQSKHMTTGDGGMVVANEDKRFGRELRLCGDKGWPRAKGGRDHLFLAPNYHMTELQAAVGLAQLKKLPAMVQARIDAADRLTARLAEVDVEPAAILPNSRGVFFYYAFRLDPTGLRAPVKEVMRAMSAEGIDGFIGYPGPIPLYRYPVIRERLTFGSSGWPFTLPGVTRNWDYSDSLCPEAEKACAETICMWWSEGLTAVHADQIGDAIEKVVTAYSA
ncbi:MAG: DegT/DnrJ/EryC1/StrS family aminotransferase [Hyphomicrobiales bacterium]|jgi:perosamine synthetase|nr:DegT/DnrJ/EryC1/StrS family aminotransferase [Methylobacterium sp.]MCE2931842.1 DegT/DnrJ/EryC1/StrS family aminotransferase [Hyphomicrobiales bacterium]MCZ8271605.1 DegT/DnrJ/EryC1/StrS family aminotransferase [Beijerinckiaceae bacterium]